MPQTACRSPCRWTAPAMSPPFLLLELLGLEDLRLRVWNVHGFSGTSQSSTGVTLSMDPTEVSKKRKRITTGMTWTAGPFRSMVTRTSTTSTLSSGSCGCRPTNGNAATSSDVSERAAPFLRTRLRTPNTGANCGT